MCIWVYVLAAANCCDQGLSMRSNSAKDPKCTYMQCMCMCMHTYV